MSNYILEINAVSKRFPSVKALDEVSFAIEEGSVHALVGENGAGKSTLIKLLAGIYHPDGGSLVFKGQPIQFRSPSDARAHGVAVVHQEIKLAEPLSVAENIFLGGVPTNKRGLVDWKKMRAEAQRMLRELDVDIDVDLPVEKLSVAKKQIVEIVRAISMNCRLIIMDEPSATLTDHELEILFKIIRELREKGITIIYISHRMDEIFDLADRVTVLRDGKHVGTLPIEQVTRKELIRMMVGRELGQEFPKIENPPGEVILEVEHLTREGVLDDISFKVRSGEIVGISGLVGSGRTELARALVGIDPYDKGRVLLRGREVKFSNFSDAIKAGLGLIPEDRKLQGLVQIMNIRQNMTLVNLDAVCRTGIISAAKEKEVCEKYVKSLRIATPSLETQAQFLSGGNQQKVVIAKWLIEDNDILILDEPTRGVDVGAKTEIYKLINLLIQSGKTVIMISSELPEILGMCDRVLVLHEGRLVGELSHEEASQEMIMSLCV